MEEIILGQGSAVKEAVKEALDKRENIIVEIRTGVAKKLQDELPVLQPKSLNLDGDFASVIDFYEKRKHLLKPDNCHVEVITKNPTVTLVVNEKRESGIETDKIVGKMRFTPDYEKLDSILNGKAGYSSTDLVKILRKFKRFTDPISFEQTVSALRKFTATKKASVENDRTSSKNTVNTSASNEAALPNPLALRMPIFVGYGASNLVIEFVLTDNTNSFDIELWCDNVPVEIEAITEAAFCEVREALKELVFIVS